MKAKAIRERLEYRRKNHGDEKDGARKKPGSNKKSYPRKK